MKRFILVAIVAIVGQLAGIQAQNAVYDMAIAPKDTARVQSVHDPIPGPGYAGAASLDILAAGPYGNTAIGATTVHGVMFRERYYFGAGAGFLHDTGKSKWTIPVFAEGRIYFKSASRRIYPNIGIRAGGLIAQQGGTGFYSTLTAGVRIPLGRRLGLIGEVGPQLTSKYVSDGYNAPYRSQGNRFGFAIRVGLSF